MEFEHAVRQLAHRLGVDIRLDAGRSCRLVFDGRTAVDLEGPANVDGVMLMHGVVGTLPAVGSREAIYETLLAGSLFGRDTGDAALGVDADLGEILLFRRIPLAALKFEDLVDMLEDFVARATAWTDRLRSMDGDVGLIQATEPDHYIFRV